MYLKWTNTTQTEDRGKKDRDVKEIFFIEKLDQMAVTWCEERDFTGLIALLELAGVHVLSVILLQVLHG